MYPPSKQNVTNKIFFKDSQLFTKMVESKKCTDKVGMSNRLGTVKIGLICSFSQDIINLLSKY